MDKFEYPLDNLNYIFTFLSIGIIVLDCVLYQFINGEMSWSIFSKRNAGFYEYEDGGATDNSSDIDSQVSSSDDDCS